MQPESHLNIIGRFALTIAVYFLGMCVTVMIFFLMVGLEAFVRDNLNWNIFFGTPIAASAKWAIEDSVWIFAKCTMFGANIVLLSIAAKILGVFKSADKEIKTSQPQRADIKYSIIYSFIGLVFSLGAVVAIGIGYFFIGAFAGLKFIGHPMHWSDGFIILVMPVVLAATTAILFVIAGMKCSKNVSQ